jgi:F-type H+-transporting ATPase subunit a
MPQPDQPTSVRPYVGRPLQIAQAGGTDPGAPGTTEKPAGETHAETKAESSDPGKIPDAMLLLQNSVVVALVMVVFAFAARKRLEAIPRGVQNLGETLVERLTEFTVGIIGPGGERYTPLVGTVFIYILLMNMIGTIPGFHSPTANLSITLALGLVIWCYVQYQGVRQNGLGGYIKHFMGPMPALAPLMFPVEIISDLVRPFTLAVRLFGNIFGEDVIIIVLAGLGLKLAGSALGWLPLQFPVMLLALLTDIVQAGVFAILTCIYISLVSHHEHEGAHGEEGALAATHPAH